jgi:predicted ATPase
MRYILTGAQGVGKTSILRKFEGRMNLVTEVVRNLAKNEHIAVNEEGNMRGQSRIFDTYEEVLSKRETPFISDRGLTDVIAYTCYNMKDKGAEGKKFLDDQITHLNEFQNKYGNDTIYFYIPIEFEVEYDGFRSTNEDFRKEIDKNIKDLLDGMGVDYIELRGTVEERLEIIENIMRNYGDLE